MIMMQVIRLALGPEWNPARIRLQRHDEKGIADNIVDVYRIAQMVRSHGTGYERTLEPQNTEAFKEFGITDISLLLPRTWQEVLVVYADLKNSEGKIWEDVNERLAKAIRRKAKAGRKL